MKSIIDIDALKASNEARPPLRQRPVSVGQLRTFVALAQHLHYRAAAEALALTQSAVSRQIQALEHEVGAALFLRHTRRVELTAAGGLLLRACTQALGKIDHAVQEIRHSHGRPFVAVSTWASFASMWLIPRLESFQRQHPDIDIRIDATDAYVDVDRTDVDLALRYARPEQMPSSAVRLFGEQITPVASRWLLQHQSIVQVEDLRRCTLIESIDAAPSAQLKWLSWQRWLAQYASPATAHTHSGLAPQSWLYLNYAYQIVQAALAGQGVALGRLPLVAENLARGELIEVLPHTRLQTPMAYWLLTARRAPHKPEAVAFVQWLLAQAHTMRQSLGE